jgi:hypothetical protein
MNEQQTRNGTEEIICRTFGKQPGSRYLRKGTSMTINTGNTDDAGDLVTPKIRATMKSCSSVMYATES